MGEWRKGVGVANLVHQNSGNKKTTASKKAEAAPRGVRDVACLLITLVCNLEES